MENNKQSATLLEKISNLGVAPTDNESCLTKKRALTLIPFYVSIPALFLAGLYFYFGHIEASVIPISYICISLASAFYLYKTKKFFHFEVLQLVMILVLPFALMWTLGGFNESSFVFIWAFYAPIAAAMYSENSKIEIAWFIAFIILLIISILLNSSLAHSHGEVFPELILDTFFLLNIGAGLGGIYFLITHFINNIKTISTELKRDRESLYKLTQDLKHANKELEHLAKNDMITDLPNRHSYSEVVKKMFAQAKRNERMVAIMFLDLDGFKAINDTMGHEAGDMILKVVGSRLTSLIRASDVVSRIGGDEFAVALGEISEVKHVEQVARSIIKEVNELCNYKGKDCRVGVSIGISFYPKDGDDVETLLKKADDAMYVTKKSGKNNYSIFCQK